MGQSERTCLGHREIGKRGLSGLSFICIPPGSAVVYRVIVYVIVYLLAGRALAKRESSAAKGGTP